MHKTGRDGRGKRLCLISVVLLSCGAAAVEAAPADDPGAPTLQAFVTAAPVRDILPGAESSNPDQFLAIGNEVFFAASDALSPPNIELWRAGGSVNTLPVLDFANSGAPEELTDVNGTLFFTAVAPDLGRELWQNTQTGAALVRDINPGMASATPRGLTAVGDKLYFSANDGTFGRELWVLDTVSGASDRVADITPGSDSTVFFSNPTGGSNFAAFGELLMFAADDGINGLELWRSDGTAPGTWRIDINPGQDSALNFSLDPVTSAPVRDMLAAGDTFYFSADDGTSGRELWSSDGDTAQRVADIRSGVQGSDPLDFAELDGDLVFVANDGATGREPWISTHQGTTQALADIAGGFNSSLPGFLTNVNGRVYFQADSAGLGAELWVTNGSPSGTQLVKDIRDGTFGSFPGKMVRGPDGLAYFSADDGIHGMELWRSNGSPESTELVADIAPGAEGSAIFNRLAATEDRLYFSASDGLTGSEPWSVRACPELGLKGDPPATVCEAGVPPPPRKIAVVFMNAPGARERPTKLVLASKLQVAKTGSGEYYFKAAAEGANSVVALDGTTITPDPDVDTSLVFGLASSFYQGEVYDAVTEDSDFDGIPDSKDSAKDEVDANRNGVPDVNEDLDGDGLSFADEFYFGPKYNETLADTDNDQVPDAVDFLVTNTRRDFTTIPVLINIYQTNNSTEADVGHLTNAIHRANIILRKAKIALALAQVRTSVTLGDAGVGPDGVAGDGRINNQLEYNLAIALGWAEVRNLPARKGLKISAVSTGADSIRLPDKDNGGVLRSANGAASMNAPVVLLRQQAALDLTAQTIAHELGHVLRLPHFPDGPARAPGNLMTMGSPEAEGFVLSTDPDKGLANVTLEPMQLATIESSRLLAQIGKRGTRRSPGQKTRYASGGAIDAMDDQLAGEAAHLDLWAVQAAADGGADRVQFLIDLGTSLPTQEGQDAIYKLLIDTDNNAGTGAEVQGVAGIDREIDFIVFNEPGGQFTVASQTTHPAATGSLILPAPTVHPNTIIAEGDFGSEVPLGDTLEAAVTRTDLALSADQVPMTVLAMTADGEVADSVEFIYDRLRWQADPVLLLQQEYATPGEMVAFTVAGMAPGESFALTVSGTLVASGTLDSQGGFEGAFPAPSAVGEDVQFVVMTDPTGRFAENVLVIPNRLFADGFE